MTETLNRLKTDIEKVAVEVDGRKIIGVHTVRLLINRAESDWEKDCCEWKHRETHAWCLSDCSGLYEDYDLVFCWKFCPYCGKPIKISEVE